MGIQTIIRPAVALAGTAAASGATAATTLDVNYTPSIVGTPVAIGVPDADAQYTFGSGVPGTPFTGTIKLTANGSALLGELDSARFPTATEAQSTQVKTYEPGLPIGGGPSGTDPLPSSSLEFVGLRFAIGGVQQYGYATLTDEGSVIDTITYDVFPTGGQSVPEPATWATMIAGMGAAGALLRRRRRAQPANA